MACQRRSLSLSLSLSLTGLTSSFHASKGQTVPRWAALPYGVVAAMWFWSAAFYSRMPLLTPTPYCRLIRHAGEHDIPVLCPGCGPDATPHLWRANFAPVVRSTHIQHSTQFHIMSERTSSATPTGNAPMEWEGKECKRKIVKKSSNEGEGKAYLAALSQYDEEESGEGGKQARLIN